MQTPKTDSMNELTSTSVVLETRLKELNKARQIINNVHSLEEFMNFKLKISQIFFDLDQEIRETLQNIKNAQLQNKEIANEKEFISLKISNLESKLTNSENFICELKQNNKELVNQINFQQEKIINNESLIIQLQAKLAQYEEGSDSMQDKNENTIPDKFINIISNNSSGINNANFVSSQMKHEKITMDSKGKNTISIRLSKGKDEIINRKETNENLSNLNFIYNSPSLSNKFDAESIYNQNNNFNVNGEQDTINREDKFYMKKQANENQHKHSIEVEKNSYKNLKSQRENSKKMLVSILNENLFEIENENKAEAHLNLNNDIKNESKPSKKIPEIRIENNNGTKNDARYDMPRVNRIAYDNLNHFHDEKRKIEETAGILPEETSNNLNSLSNLILTNSLQDRKNQISNHNHNNMESSNLNNNQAHKDHQIKSYPNQYNNGNYKNNESNRNSNTIEKNINALNNNNQNDNSNNKNKNKPDRIIQIIMKIKTCPDTSAIVSQLFGEDILERIISPDTEEETINDLEQIISEIETLKMNNNNNNFNNKLQIDDNLAVDEENIQNPSKQRKFNNKHNNDNYLNAPLQSNFLNNHKTNLYEYSNNNNSNSKNNQSNYDEINDNNNVNLNTNNYAKKNNLTTKDSSSKRLEYHTNPNNNHYNLNNNMNFDSITKYTNDVISENNLGKVSSSKSNRFLNKSQSKVLLDEFKEERWGNPNFESMLRNYKGNNSNAKIFKNYTKKGSEFFDPTLQRGGVSKLDYDGRRKRSKSNSRGINENSVLGKSIEKGLVDKSYVMSKQLPNRNINYRDNYQEILGRRDYEFNYD